MILLFVFYNKKLSFYSCNVIADNEINTLNIFIIYTLLNILNINIYITGIRNINQLKFSFDGATHKKYACIYQHACCKWTKRD